MSSSLNQEMRLGEELTFFIPPVGDSDADDSLTISAPSITDFGTFDQESSLIIFTPTTDDLLGEWTIEIAVTDDN
jgi:hypothetical protein